MNKITVRQSNGCYFTTMLLRTREDLLPGKTSLPLCCSRAVCSGSWSTAGSAPPSWAGADPALRAQGSTGTYWSNRGGSWTAVQQQQAHFCTDSQGLSRTGTMLGPYSSSLNSHQGLRDATEVTISLPSVPALIWTDLWLLPTWLREMWPAGSPGAHRTPVSFPHPWERIGGMSTQQNSSEPMLQQPLPCHSPVSKHTG